MSIREEFESFKETAHLLSEEQRLIELKQLRQKLMKEMVKSSTNKPCKAIKRIKKYFFFLKCQNSTLIKLGNSLPKE